MKKIISLFLCAVCIVTLAAVSQTTTLAAETAEVPKLYITTDNGSGLSLQKEDGYTDAHIKVTENGESVADESVVVKVRGNSTAMARKKSFTFKFSKKRDLLGMGKGKVFQPIRVAVVGGAASPGIGETLALAGKEHVLARIDRALPLAKR